MARLRDALAAAALVAGALLTRRRTPPGPGPGRPVDPRERIVEAAPRRPGSELLVIALLGAGTLCAIAFVAVYALDRLPRQTQLLGLSIGLALAFVAAALIVLSKRLVPQEHLAEDYPVPQHPAEQERVARVVEESASGVSRRGLLKLALGGAAGALGVALVVPAASLGPVLDTGPLLATPWRRGRRLVREDGSPVRADDIEPGTFLTAFPEGADKEELAAPVVVVRPGNLRLPRELAGWDAAGIVAYSKICTHAGCAVALYRTPYFEPAAPRPALVCPCHYSTFDPATGGKVTFGPAGRKLPMLPLQVGRDGVLEARGTFDGPVGPSWWGVRMKSVRPAPDEGAPGGAAQ